ncbi:MAG: hypothetical protein QM702_20750 [Rubrivivax sp.]
MPLGEVVDRLPHGLCARLLAVPVRRDAITGTVDVVVADPRDTHAAREISFHLDVPVRVVRAPVGAIEEALRRLRMRVPPPPTSSRPRSNEPPSYDSRPRPFGANSRPPPPPPVLSTATKRMATLPPPASARPPGRGSYRPPSEAAPDALLAALDSGALRPSKTPSMPLAPPVPRAGSRETPAWGTPVHGPGPEQESEPPKSGLGSEIPIPLTRRAMSAVGARGGTQRPPPPPDRTPLGEGYALPLDPKNLQVVEVRSERHFAEERQVGTSVPESFIPGPPPAVSQGPFPAYSGPSGPFGGMPDAIMPSADLGGILGAVRGAGSRDEVLELVLTGARMLAYRVALFVVKRGGYLGWACTAEFADRASLQRILIPLDRGSVFDEAVQQGIYLGPILSMEVHATLLHVMRTATNDVAFVPIRVSGKTAVIIVADELGDTMVATRRLEELARAAGDSFARIVRMRR